MYVSLMETYYEPPANAGEAAASALLLRSLTESSPLKRCARMQI